jgi:flagellar basal-body rod protein FlgC
MNTINTALSGLQAAATRLAGAASNTANMNTRGPVPATPPSEPLPAKTTDEPRVYQAVETVQTTDAGGGARARHQPVKPAYLVEYAPDSAYANEDGEVAAPNVDTVRDTVDQMEALRAFRANLSVIRTAEDMDESVLNIKA